MRSGFFFFEFRPESAVSAVSADTGRFRPESARVGPNQLASARVGENHVGSTWPDAAGRGRTRGQRRPLRVAASRRVGRGCGTSGAASVLHTYRMPVLAFDFNQVLCLFHILIYLFLVDEISVFNLALI